MIASGFVYLYFPSCKMVQKTTSERLVCLSNVLVTTFLTFNDVNNVCGVAIIVMRKLNNCIAVFSLDDLLLLDKGQIEHGALHLLGGLLYAIRGGRGKILFM